MTIDEVNERFPTLKYKVWRAGRERMGLSTEGGVKTAPNSRPASMREADDDDLYESPSSPSQSSPSTELPPPHSPHLQAPPPAASNSNPPEGGAPVDTTAKQETTVKEDAVKEDAVKEDVAKEDVAKEDATVKDGDVPDVSKASAATLSIKDKRLSDASELDASKKRLSTDKDHASDDEDEHGDEDHPQSAVPDELLKTVGDSCAICLDVIEDDDDVRGLTCGHTFHCGCLDPWLTNRRACCPLCKADYYVPKPRPEGEAAGAAGDAGASSRDSRGRRQARGGDPNGPNPASGNLFIGPPFHRRILFASTNRPRYNSPFYGGRGNSRDARQPPPPPPHPSQQQQQGRRWLRNPLAGVSLPNPASMFRRNRNAADAAAHSAPPDVEASLPPAAATVQAPSRAAVV